jgi:hypothetical protein
LRWEEEGDVRELTAYLRRLAGHAEVVVVDGSPPHVFAWHARAWAGFVRHLPPDEDLAYVTARSTVS